MLVVFIGPVYIYISEIGLQDNFYGEFFCYGYTKAHVVFRRILSITSHVLVTKEKDAFL